MKILATAALPPVQGYSVLFQALEETVPIEQAFGKEETGVDWSDLIESHYAGETAYFTAHIQVKKEGIEVGEAYLGCCCYDDISDFYTKYAGDYLADMVLDAIADAEGA